MSIRKNVVYNTLLTISNVAFPVITAPYVSRVLGVENIGTVNFVITYVLYFTLFAALGIPVYGIREIAKNKDSFENRSQIFSELFLVNVISTFVVLLIYFITIFSIPTLVNNRDLLLISGVAILLVPFNIEWFFSGMEKFKLIAIRSILIRIISLCGLFIFVRSRNDLIAYIALNTVVNVSSHVWLFGYMALKKEVKFLFRGINIKKHMKPVMILFASNVAVSIYTILDTLMLGFMSDNTQVGYYTSAMKISKMILPVVTALSPVMIARISNLKAGANDNGKIMELLNRSFEFMLIVALPVTIGLICISPRFVPFFFGDEFIPATVSMQILSSVVLIIGISNLFGKQILVAMGEESRFFKAILFGTITSVSLNLLLIGRFGSLGASISAVIAEIVVMITTILFSLRVISVRIKIKGIVQPLLAALPIIPISLYFGDVLKNDFLYLSVTTITSGVLYFVLMIYVFHNEWGNQFIGTIMQKIKSNKN